MLAIRIAVAVCLLALLGACGGRAHVARLPLDGSAKTVLWTIGHIGEPDPELIAVDIVDGRPASLRIDPADRITALVYNELRDHLGFDSNVPVVTDAKQRTREIPKPNAAFLYIADGDGRWVVEAIDDAVPKVRIPILALSQCANLGGCIASDSLDPFACIEPCPTPSQPASPQSPATPDGVPALPDLRALNAAGQWSCPSTWTEVPLDHGSGCQPPMLALTATCTLAGTAQFYPSAFCESVGAACPTTDRWPDLSAETHQVVYVDPSSTSVLRNGMKQAPYRTIADALASAMTSTDAVIALAPDDYPEIATVEMGRTMRGACAEAVRVEAIVLHDNASIRELSVFGLGGRAIFVESTDASNRNRIANVVVEAGAGTGIECSSPGFVDVDRTVVRGREVGIWAASGTVSITGAVVEGSSAVGVRVTAAQATIQDLAVRTQIGGAADTIHAVDVSANGGLLIERAFVEGGHAGIVVDHGKLVAKDLAFRRLQHRDIAAIFVGEGSTATISRVQIRDTAGPAASISGRVMLTDVWANAASPITFEAGSTAALRRAWVMGSQRPAIIVRETGSATIADVIADEIGSFALLLTGSVHGKRIASVGALKIAVLISGSLASVEISDLTIKDTLEPEASIRIADGSTVALDHLRLETTGGIGLQVIRSTGKARSFAIRTASAPLRGQAIDCTASSSVTLERGFIDGSLDFALRMSGLKHGRVQDLTIQGVHGESVPGVIAFEDGPDLFASRIAISDAPATAIRILGRPRPVNVKLEDIDVVGSSMGIACLETSSVTLIRGRFVGGLHAIDAQQRAKGQFFDITVSNTGGESSSGIHVTDTTVLHVERFLVASNAIAGISIDPEGIGDRSPMSLVLRDGTISGNETGAEIHTIEFDDANLLDRVVYSGNQSSIVHTIAPR